MNPIICLGAGKNQYNALSLLYRLGYILITIDRDSNAPGHMFSEFPIVCSTHDYHLISSKLSNITSCVNPSFLVKSSGLPVVSASFGFPYSVDFVEPFYAN